MAMHQTQKQTVHVATKVSEEEYHTLKALAEQQKHERFQTPPSAFRAQSSQNGGDQMNQQQSRHLSVEDVQRYQKQKQGATRGPRVWTNL